MKPVIAFRELLDFKAPDDSTMYQYILIEPPANVLYSFANSEDISAVDEQTRQDLCEMISFKFYHYTKKMPAIQFFKLKPGNYNDDESVIEEFSIKYKEWLSNNKIGDLKKDFE